MKELPKRKQNRIGAFDYAAAGTYFITVCTAGREKLFWANSRGGYHPPAEVALSDAGKIAEQGILQISGHYPQVAVEKYCIMPDHIHLILRIESDGGGRMISAPTVSTVVGSLKRWVSRQIGKPVWQKSFYDHGIRNQQDFDEIWKYIEENPLKYKLKNAP